MPGPRETPPLQNIENSANDATQVHNDVAKKAESEAKCETSRPTTNTSASPPGMNLDVVTSASHSGSSTATPSNIGASPSASQASPSNIPAYSQDALRDLVCATLAPEAAANLMRSEKRDKEVKRISVIKETEPQPGPSGLQSSSRSQGSSSGSKLQNSDRITAPDLQLDCLSSDSDESCNEDVQVVRIPRKKGKKTSKLPVEVDLTQEMTSDDDDITIEEVKSKRKTSTVSSKIEISIQVIF